MPALDSCFLLPLGLRNIFATIAATPAKSNPSVEVMYCYVPNNQSYRNMAISFVESWVKNPPGYGCRLTIGVNGSEPANRLNYLFGALPERTYFEHTNEGWDLGLYQRAARVSTADLLVFFTASTYFTRPGWLARMVQAYQAHGEALYGAMANKGDARLGINRHLRSTAFWCSRALFNAYPVKVRNKRDRYLFEHKDNCFTEWVLQGGLQAWEITWEKELPWLHWNEDPFGYAQGDQHNLIAGDHLTKPPYYPRR